MSGSIAQEGQKSHHLEPETSIKEEGQLEVCHQSREEEDNDHNNCASQQYSSLNQGPIPLNQEPLDIKIASYEQQLLADVKFE